MKYEFKGTSNFTWRATKRNNEESQIPWAIEGVRADINGVLPIADLCSNPNNKEVIEANAHLFAASKDLLQAAINALTTLEAYHEPKYASVTNELKTAIHKALNIEG